MGFPGLPWAPLLFPALPCASLGFRRRRQTLVFGPPTAPGGYLQPPGEEAQVDPKPHSGIPQGACVGDDPRACSRNDPHDDPRNDLRNDTRNDPRKDPRKDPHNGQRGLLRDCSRNKHDSLGRCTPGFECAIPALAVSTTLENQVGVTAMPGAGGNARPRTRCVMRYLISLQ